MCDSPVFERRGIFLQTAKRGGLNGTLPASISDLSRLAYLDFSGNALSGNLPVLPASIKEVNLQANNLSNSGYAEAVPASYGEPSRLGKCLAWSLRLGAMPYILRYSENTMGSNAWLNLRIAFGILLM